MTSVADSSAVSLATVTESSQHVDYEIYADLKERYDALSQQFMTMELQKKELFKEVKKLREQNEELQELEQREHDEIEQFEQFTKPLTGSLASMSAALGDADMLSSSMSMQNDEYKTLTERLTEENNILREQNEKYRSTMQKMQISSRKKENEHKHKISLLEAEIEDINKAETDIVNHYAQLQDDYSILKKETKHQLQTQMENVTITPDVGIGMGFDKSVHISSTFVRSGNDILPENYLKAGNLGVSQNNLVVVQYDSVQSLPELNSDYNSDDSATAESIEDRHIDRGHVGAMGKIDENETLDKENWKDKENEMQNLIFRLENDVKQRDKSAEQKTKVMKGMESKVQNKDNEIKRLKKHITRLQKQNTLLHEHKNGDNQCFALKWFK